MSILKEKEKKHGTRESAGLPGKLVYLDDASRGTLAREGVKVEHLISIQAQLGLTVKETALLMNVSESTLLRRYKQPDSKLSRHESDILLHLMEVLGEGLKVYESMAVLRHWLTLPLPALDGEVPLQLLSSIRGRNQLLDIFNQLKHGYTF